MAPTFVWNIMLNARGGVRSGLPVAGEGIWPISSGLASVKSRGCTAASAPWTAFLRFSCSAAAWRSSVVFSLSRAET